jgi:chromosome segregation ATPase
MEELIIEYLLEKGGIFGVMFAIALFWIVFRERMLFMSGGSKKSEKKADNTELEKVLYENLKNGLDDVSEKTSGISDKISDIEKKIQDLHDWHAVKDAEGVPLWYVRRSLEGSIGSLEKSVVDLKTQMLENLKYLDNVIEARDDASEKLQKVNDERVAELKSIIENYNNTMNDLSRALDKSKYALRSSNGE